MEYFDQNDPVEVDIVVRNNVILITNHEAGTQYSHLKFSVRRWYEKEDKLNPGKGFTMTPEDAWELVLRITEAAVRAKIPMWPETRTKILTALAETE